MPLFPYIYAKIRVSCDTVQSEPYRRLDRSLHAGVQFERNLGEIVALGAEFLPYIGLREKWESS